MTDDIDDGWVNQDEVPTVPRIVLPVPLEDERPTLQHPVSERLLAMLAMGE